MMYPRTFAGRSWSDAERRLLRFAGPEQPKAPEDDVTKLRAELEAVKTRSRGYEQQLLEMRTRMDSLEQTVRRVPSTLPRLPDNVSPRVAVRGAVDNVLTKIDPAPAPGYGMRYERGIVYRARPGAPRDSWQQLKTMAQVRDDLQRERTARHTWIRDQRTKARFSPNLPMGGVSADEYVGRTFDALDRRHEAGRPGFRSPSEGHFATQALYASMRGDYARVESNTSMYIDRTGSDRAHYAQFGGDPLEARDGYYGVGSGYYGPRGPGGGRSIAYPYGYDRQGKIDPADYGVRGGDVSWADRGGKDYASYNYPSRYSPAAAGGDMQKYMRTQSRLRESYADDIESEYMPALENGKLRQKFGADPGWASLEKAMIRASSQWGRDPSRRYGDLAILRSQVGEMSRRDSQRNQQQGMIMKIRNAADQYNAVSPESPSPSDAPRYEPEVQGVYKSFDLNPRNLFFNRGEKTSIVIPADVLGTQRDYAVQYDPGVWNGDLSDEQFAALKRGGIAIERHESDTVTYAQGLSRVPKVEKLTVYFTKSGSFTLNGMPVDIPLNPLYKGPKSPGRAPGMPEQRRGNVPGTYSPSFPRSNEPYPQAEAPTVRQPLETRPRSTVIETPGPTAQVLPKQPVDVGSPRKTESANASALREFDVVLKRFGESLVISEPESPAVRLHLRQLNLLPAPLVQRMVALGVKIRLSNKDVMGVSNGPEWKSAPRGWNQKDWTGIAGAFNQGSDTVYAGNGRHGSTSLVLHEFGHAFGKLMGKNADENVVAAHKRLYEKLSTYERQGGPGGASGTEEFLAESFGEFFVLPEAQFVQRYDQQWYNYLRVSTLRS